MTFYFNKVSGAAAGSLGFYVSQSGGADIRNFQPYSSSVFPSPTTTSVLLDLSKWQHIAIVFDHTTK